MDRRHGRRVRPDEDPTAPGPDAPLRSRDPRARVAPLRGRPAEPPRRRAGAPTGITARLEDLPYFVEVKGIAGTIERGLREDTVAAGVPARIAADLADIFGWDVDVETGLRPGDEFRVIYENIWQVGMPAPQAGKVLAAELVVGGKKQTAVLFEDEDGEGGYYAPSGESVSRTFLRYPVEFTEITLRVLARSLPPDPPPVAAASGASTSRRRTARRCVPRRTASSACRDGRAASARPSGSTMRAASRRPTGISRAIAPAVVAGATRRARAGDRLRRLDRALDRAAPPLRAHARRRPRRPARVHLRSRAVDRRRAACGSSTARKREVVRQLAAIPPHARADEPVAVDDAPPGGGVGDALSRRPAPASVRPSRRVGHAPREHAAVLRRRARRAAPIASSSTCMPPPTAHVVVLHDAMVDRTTNGSGPGESAAARGAPARSTPAIASPRADGSHPYRGQGIRVPTLRELLAAYPDVPLNIEIKQDDPPIVDRRAGRPRSRSVRASARCWPRSISTSWSASAPPRPTCSPALVGRGRRLRVPRCATAASTTIGPTAVALQVPPAFGDMPIVTAESVAAAHRSRARGARLDHQRRGGDGAPPRPGRRCDHDRLPGSRSRRAPPARPPLNGIRGRRRPSEARG